MLGDGGEVLVAPAGEIDHHQMILRLLRCEINHLGERMRRLQCGDDAFKLGNFKGGFQRIFVGDA